MVRPPEMDPAMGSRNHMAMDMHARRRPNTRGHRLGHVHVAIMSVVGGFAGTAHARSGGGSAVQQRNSQRSQQADQCRSKHRMCPSPAGARSQRLLTRDMPVLSATFGQNPERPVTGRSVSNVSRETFDMQPTNERAPGRFPSALQSMPGTRDGAGDREFQTLHNAHPAEGFRRRTVIFAPGHCVWRLGKPPGRW